MKEALLARWDAVDALVQEALGMEPDAQARYVAASTGGDAELAALVRQVLARATDASPLGDQAKPFDDVLLAALAADHDALDDGAAASPLAGQRVGPYVLLREIGVGGMGVVYLARRDDGHYQQEVALKLIQRGRATAETLQRFRVERQILATLTHPHIARLLDGGLTPDGLPYLALEYVDGEPITTYCEARRLPVDARVRLVTTVCEAVQYAHQNLVIHRDLKPSNILVADGPGGEPVVKLLDFGVAKLLGGAETIAVTMPLTVPGRAYLTPAYAAPEQVAEGMVTTASDVYALGVLLYELLTGRPPATATDGTTATALPRKPSAQTAPGHAPTLASTPERLANALRGDLDALALKALAPEPARRYPTADALRADLLRYLDGLPIAARPPTARYRTARFLARHRRSAVAVAMALLVLVVLSTLYALGLRDARDAAEASARAARAEAAKAEAVTAYTLGLFDAADPNATQGADVTVREVLLAGAERIRSDRSLEPAVRVRMLRALGQTHHRLGLLGEADPLLAESARLARSAYGPEHPETARAYLALSALRRAQGHAAEADTLSRRAVAASQADALLRVRALTERGLALRTSGRYAEGLATVRRAYADFAAPSGAALSDAPDEVARVALALAQTLETWSRYDEVLTVLPEALARYDTDRPGPTLEKAYLLEVWGRAYLSMGRTDAAREPLRRALGIADTLVGPVHPLRATLLALLADTETDPDVQRAAYREALRILQQSGRSTTTAASSVWQALGTLNVGEGRGALGRAQLDSAYAITERLYGPSIALGNVVSQRGRLALDAGAWAEAEVAFRDAVGQFEPVVLPSGSANLVRAWSGLGDALAGQRRWADAAEAYAQAVAAVAAVAPLHHDQHRTHALDGLRRARARSDAAANQPTTR